MQSETAKVRLLVLTLLSLGFMAVGSNAAAQQSIEDNIRPVGQVCLAGQPCVGNIATSRASSTASSAATSAPQADLAPAAPAPAAAEVEPAAQEQAAAPAEDVAAFDVEATYQMSCFACHGTGAAGAPVLGDTDVWTERMGKGMDAVMANVINGMNAMPPKGLCMTCSDDNLRALVDYMAGQ